MTREQANGIIAENEAMAAGCTYNILFTNDIVASLTIEAVEAVRKSPLYRMKTKQAVNRAETERKRYEKLVNEVIGDRSGFFADANDIFAEEIRKHLDILYWSIKREFDRCDVKYPDIAAKMELARTLCEFGCLQLDRREEELQAKDIRFRCFRIDYLRQTALSHTLNEAMRTMNVPCTVDLNTEDCTRAINILSVKLADAETIAKAISA